MPPPRPSTPRGHVSGEPSRDDERDGRNARNASIRLVDASAVGLVSGTTYRVIEGDHQLNDVTFVVDADGNSTVPVDGFRITCTG